MAENLLTDAEIKGLRPGVDPSTDNVRERSKKSRSSNIEKHREKLAAQGEVILNDGGGLQVRARRRKEGPPSIEFRWRFKAGGADRFFALGDYDPAAQAPAEETWAPRPLTLAQARDYRNEARKLLLTGTDPNDERRQRIQARKDEAEQDRTDLTVEQLFARWRMLHLQKNRRDGGEETQRRFAKDVFPIIGQRKAKVITRKQIGTVLDRVVERGARRVANVLLTDLRQMFRFALVRDLVDIDPTSLLKKDDFGGKETPRKRNLSLEEVADLFRKLPESGLAPNVQAAVRFLLATGCRSGELITAQWNHVDKIARQWRIPMTKNGDGHTVFLSDFTMHQIRVMERYRANKYLLAGRMEGTHYDEKALSKMVRDRTRVTPLKNRSKKTGTLTLEGGDWSPHDLRRTLASRMAEKPLSVHPWVIERCLNHREQNRMIATYQQSDYEDEMRAAWTAWGDNLAEIDPEYPRVALVVSNTQLDAGAEQATK